MYTYFTYILLCSDGTYYTGVTNNVERRFQEHVDGISPRSYTAARRPLKLVYVELFQWIRDAIAREKQIKEWHRAWKIELIETGIAPSRCTAK